MNKLKQICHVFNVHSHITYLVAMRVITEKKLDLSECVFLLTRGYKIPDANPQLKVCDLLFPLSDLSVYYNEKRPEHCRQNFEKLRHFTTQMTSGRPFHLYLPCTHMFHAIILLSYDDCIGYSLIEEGLQVYLPFAESQSYSHLSGKELSQDVVEQCRAQRLLYLGSSRPFCLFRHPKFDRAYCIDSDAFPFISQKTVLQNPFRPEKYPDCEDADALIVLSNEQSCLNLEMRPFLDCLDMLIERDFKPRGFKKVLYRTKEIANQAKYLQETHSFFRSRTDIEFVHMDSNRIAENVIKRYKFPVYSLLCSIAHYAAVSGAVSRSFAELYEDFDPAVRRFPGWKDYKTIIARSCEMLDKKNIFGTTTKASKEVNMNLEAKKSLSSPPKKPVAPKAYRPSQPVDYQGNVHIAMVSDDNYLPHVCALMASIAGNAKPGVNYCFHLIHASPYNASNQKKLEEFRNAHQLDITTYLIKKDQFDSMRLPIKHISQAMYYRFLLTSLLPNSIEKVLYLDCDMIATSCVSELYGTDLENHYAGVVFQQDFRWCITAPNLYFNSGLLLLNLKKMRQDGIELKLFEFEAKNRTKLEAPDQDVYNAVFNGNVLWMSLKWNMMMIFDRYYERFLRCGVLKLFTLEEVHEARRNPAIVHYYCAEKPWNSWSPYSDHYWKWARKTPFYDAKLHRSLAPPNHSVNMKNKIVRILYSPFNLTFHMTKKTVKFFLRPLKLLTQRLVHAACHEQVRMLHDIFKEQRMFAKGNKNWSDSIIREVRNSAAEQTKLLERVFTEQRRFAQSNKERVETILCQLCEIREELADRSEIEARMKFLLDEIGQNRDPGDMLAEMRRQTEKGFSELCEKQKLLTTLLTDDRALFDMLENHLETLETHRKEDREFTASTAKTLVEKLNEIEKAVAERRDEEFAVRLLETEKRFELERQYEMEKTLAEHEEMRNKNFEERLETENKAYYQKRLKEDFPSLSSGHAAGFMKRQNKPFVFIAGAAFSGTSIMNTVLGQHPEIYPFRTFVLSGKETTNGESCLFDANRNPNMPEHEIIRHLDEVVQKAKGKKIVLEKVADNLFYLGRINTFVPHSKYVCMLRDGRDLIASFLCLDGPTEKNCQFRINYWLNAIDHMEKYMRIAKNMKIVRLEDFTADPHGTLHGILEFIELDHSPEIVDYMLRYHERVNRTDIPKDRVLTGSITEGERTQRIHFIRDIQTKQPLYKDTSRWRTDIPVEFWPLMYEKIGPTLERYGYVENAEQSLKEELERYHREMESAREMEFRLEEKRRELGLIRDDSASENAA